MEAWRDGGMEQRCENTQKWNISPNVSPRCNHYYIDCDLSSQCDINHMVPTQNICFYTNIRENILVRETD